jgi:DNA-binding CsgD family transcriptional regulator
MARAEIIQVGPRTYEAFCHLADGGLTNQQIADRMFVSIQTIKTMFQRLFRQAGVQSRTELVLKVAHGEIRLVAGTAPAGDGVPRGVRDSRECSRCSVCGSAGYPTEMYELIREELALLREVRELYAHCPSEENAALVERHEHELGKLLDRLPRASISDEAPVAVS